MWSISAVKSNYCNCLTCTYLLSSQIHLGSVMDSEQHIIHILYVYNIFIRTRTPLENDQSFDTCTAMQALHLCHRLRGPDASAVCGPREAVTSGVVQCTCNQWFQPFGARRHYCQLPVSGRNLIQKRFLQFKLCRDQLPIATGCCTGVARGLQTMHIL